LAIVWIGCLIGELSGVIPIPGRIGGVDAGLVGTLALYNVPITHAASAVLAYRPIALWVPPLLAAPAFVALRRTLRERSTESSRAVTSQAFPPSSGSSSVSKAG
jgi:uncharacterized membrane protein YbhN (UPF0104 family)